MKIVEYLDKNYPSINWNILSQLFEEEGVELTEKIREYLDETPWNTNKNMLANWGIKKSEENGVITFVIDNLNVEEQDLMLSGYSSSLPENIEKLSVGDNVNIEIKGLNKQVYNCTSVVGVNNTNELTIDIVDALRSFCNSVMLFITLQPNQWGWSGVALDGSVSDSQVIEQLGTSITITITKI